MKKVIIMFMILLLTGCAFGNFSGEWKSTNHDLLKSPAWIDLYEKNYTLKKQMIAYVGQPIIQVKESHKEDRPTEAILSDPLTISARYKVNHYKILGSPAVSHQISGSISIGNNTYLLVSISDSYGIKWGIPITKDGEIYQSGIYSYDYKMIFYPNKIEINPPGVRFSVQPKILKGVSYELIYSGKNDISLNAAYKEYTANDYARPAFFQNITYQADAKQIRFKNFAIKIYEVSNEKITYMVLEDGLK